MNFESTEEYNEIINEKRKIIYTLITNYISSILNEISVKGDFSNADLLLLVDDIIENLKSIIELQIKQIPGDFVEQDNNMKYCIKEALESLEHLIDIKKEKNALLITKKSFVSENSVFKSINHLEKDLKSVVSKIMFQFNQCLSKY